MPGQLAALARLGALSHLDLQLISADQVVGGHAEAPGRDLLDLRAAVVAVGIRGEALRVLAALTGVGLAAQLVHRDGEGLVGLARDGAVGHGAGREAGKDPRGRLYLVDGQRRKDARLQTHQTSEGREMGRLLVDRLGVLLEHLVALRPGGMLELEHRLRIEEVDLAFATPLVLATDPPLAMGLFARTLQVCEVMTAGDLFGQDVEPDAPDPGDRAGEVLVDDLAG